ncbi:MAG: 3-deoxy-D-manno-octulosonic acid transferase [Desulfobulbaceae bacterium]|nr:3-deoxy-D-manno-octulosonic acid transferase [Desulfobulbaceae bacterium]
MFVLYNILQLVFLPVFLPFITLFVLCNSKYRDRIPARLGLGLAQKISTQGIPKTGSSCQTIWLHALSVGEVTSSVPLVAGLRKTYPDSRIIISVTTRTGKRVADNLLKSLADHIIDGPLDLLPVVSRFVKYLQPDLFILIETDLWPNTLLYLKNHNIPTILVNGRVSQKSMDGYRRMHFFFDPMFQSFSFLCMQTKRDRDNMEDIGLPPAKLKTLGNLKFDTAAGKANPSLKPPADLLPKDRILFICGSTHPGEEKVLINCYNEVKKTHSELFLIIAPRDTTRSAEIQSLAADHDLTTILRSDNSSASADILILDTIGELIHFYALSKIGFVGGSLVKKGGHNPIEPATMGLPVIFGPNMQDFSEIADALIQAGGATEVSGHHELAKILNSLLTTKELRTRQGQAAQQCVEGQRGVINRHLELISQLL